MDRYGKRDGWTDTGREIGGQLQEERTPPEILPQIVEMSDNIIPQI